MTRIQLTPILHNEDLGEPAQWKGARNGLKRTALMTCPGCGQIASLSGHTIINDGKVYPSVVCPADGCKFHEYIRLVGWTP